MMPRKSRRESSPHACPGRVHEYPDCRIVELPDRMGQLDDPFTGDQRTIRP